ncbi:hypothetical protein Bpfe_029095 [Biomphalaria pfeifferi]|uniref:Uncharacterized protein n=1 Tax=Biomphalaria pfeifferi TaxID=112525 RepID=A0AAD8EWB1_BIOPF|nr:hypothetical protein Bpfe_029095 [Biomphalaria pfeifferi]
MENAPQQIETSQSRVKQLAPVAKIYGAPIPLWSMIKKTLRPCGAVRMNTNQVTGTSNSARRGVDYNGHLAIES